LNFLSAPCNYVGFLLKSTGSLAAFQDNYCEGWSGASQPGDDLQSSSLVKADLSLSDFSGADLSDADLTDADLSSSNLGYASMGNANLTNTELTGADLTGLVLTFANLTGATYDEMTVFPSGDPALTPPWGLPNDSAPWDLGMIPVPEPSLGWLLLSGLAGLSGLVVLRHG
jgi:hypothetical protein